VAEWGDKEEYLQTKTRAKSMVYAARKGAQEEKFGDLGTTKQRNQIFKEAQKMKDENQDIVGDLNVLRMTMVTWHLMINLN